MKKTRILIAIPSNTGRGVLPTGFVFSLFTALTDISDDIEYELHQFGGLRIDSQRLQMVAYAKKYNFQALLMVDDDMVFPYDALSKLIKHWKSGLNVISAIYHVKGYPFHAFIMHPGTKEWIHAYEEKLYETVNLGTGCILIDMKVFDKINQPYFLVRMDLNGDLTGTEDCYFAKNCEINNIKMYVDASILCQHLQEIKIPDFFNHPYIHHKLEMDRNQKEFNGLGNVKKIEPDEYKIPIQLISHAMPRMYWQDGIDQCAHTKSFPLPINKGEKQIYKCRDCGLISEGEQIPLVTDAETLREYQVALKGRINYGKDGEMLVKVKK